jgi:hypothetical protein
MRHRAQSQLYRCSRGQYVGDIMSQTSGITRFGAWRIDANLPRSARESEIRGCNLYDLVADSVPPIVPFYENVERGGPAIVDVESEGSRRNRHPRTTVIQRLQGRYEQRPKVRPYQGL